MESLYLLIPISLLLVGLLVWFLFWSIKGGQFDDLEGPGEAILMDDDNPKPQKVRITQDGE
ncbi:cbb3-type cytochrome oxidase assembly protein CcoS [Polynucleobacter antarcticus]|uniref:Cbb3-type cytochrome oxidase assembly protein CcoS n=1 Tax=Polynucleobacter antarcticus TaxID=1743162 RepID=A0A6M9Q3T8_9BURK|nr:cbb3-type cytochrome oxidase assembly protein CcoS [Polynucleobacter antarcticus]QKM63133.1 cbb3-type cytochrome oxidase assembly protein CcoS [Polynucleobacter antarcticus]